MNLDFRDLGLGFLENSGFGMEFEKFGIWDWYLGLSLENLGFGIEFEKFGIRDLGAKCRPLVIPVYNPGSRSFVHTCAKCATLSGHTIWTSTSTP